MLRAAKTAVHALIAEISPWILNITISIIAGAQGGAVIRWIASAEVCASTDHLITGVVHDDGAIGCERAGTALLKESFIGLVK
jgi:hypothetical protein